ncbi:MAG: HPF/RaiA family ribosome-associated protein [Proteobacteria bacterium]|nr:HPF/RaiA family ribosome-associated protein [Pseudomonadota bacterium]MCZ6784343.1 HPF/RaiA family ribosome-associated protein [Pseudomonadota bacterium]
MAQAPTVSIRFKDLEPDDDLREILEKRCRHLSGEFPELNSFEITLSPNATEISAHAHVTGKDTDAASHANAEDVRQAGERALHKLERELRRGHDKRIFGQRREAQRAIGKRT